MISSLIIIWFSQWSMIVSQWNQHLFISQWVLSQYNQTPNIIIWLVFDHFRIIFKNRAIDLIILSGWWLTYETPLKNMTSSVGMMKFPTERKIKIHVPNHQPVLFMVNVCNLRLIYGQFIWYFMVSNHWYLWLIYGESMVDVLNYGVELMLMYHMHDI